jgi:hypothetical protein
MDAIESAPLTVSVPEYGDAVLGLGRNGSYEAAKAGVIPTVPVQGKLRVPWRIGLRKLAGNDDAVLEAMTRDFLAKLKQLKQRKVAA